MTPAQLLRDYAAARDEAHVPERPGPVLEAWCRLHTVHLVALSQIDVLEDIDEAVRLAFVAQALATRKRRLFEASERGAE